MKTFKIEFSDLGLDREEIYLNLGYKGQTPDEQFIEMIEQMINHVSGFCVPRIGYLILP